MTTPSEPVVDICRVKRRTKTASRDIEAVTMKNGRDFGSRLFSEAVLALDDDDLHRRQRRDRSHLRTEAGRHSGPRYGSSGAGFEAPDVLPVLDLPRQSRQRRTLRQHDAAGKYQQNGRRSTTLRLTAVPEPPARSTALLPAGVVYVR